MQCSRANRDSPFVVDDNAGGGFVGNRDKIRLKTISFENEESAGAMCPNGELASGGEDSCMVLPEWVHRSGPRRNIYFDPTKVRLSPSFTFLFCPSLCAYVQSAHVFVDVRVAPVS